MTGVCVFYCIINSLNGFIELTSVTFVTKSSARTLVFPMNEFERDKINVKFQLKKLK